MKKHMLVNIVAAISLASLVPYTAHSQAPGTLTKVSQAAVNVQTDTNLITFTNGSTSFTANLVCGGAVWSLQYQGVEYLNRHDYGRLIQSAFFAQPTGLGGSGPIYNPTEGGACGFLQSGQIYEMGSPCTWYNNSYYLGTKSEAYEFLPQDFGGNPNGTAIYYAGVTLGKYIYINVMGNANCFDYHSYVQIAQAYSSNAFAVVPAIYIRASYSVIYEWSATHGAVLNSWPSTYNTSKGYPTNLQYPSTSGGLIVEDPSTGYALGV